MAEKKYLHKGRELTPMTEAEAHSLVRGDKIKYVGRRLHSSSTFYNPYTNRPIITVYDPKVKGGELALSPYSKIKWCDWAIAEKVTAGVREFRQAKRFIPLNLKSFRDRLISEAKKVRERIDDHLEGVPLHNKLQLFRDLTPEETKIYDFLYKDMEVVMSLKEGEISE